MEQLTKIKTEDLKKIIKGLETLLRVSSELREPAITSACLNIHFAFGKDEAKYQNLLDILRRDEEYLKNCQHVIEDVYEEYLSSLSE